MTPTRTLLLRSLDRALQVVRAETSQADTPNPAIADFLYEKARATWDLLPADVQRVAWLRGLERAR